MPPQWRLYTICPSHLQPVTTREITIILVIMPTASDIVQFLRSQAFGSTFVPTDRDLSGQTIIVTGANTGLGLDACKHFARLNVAHLILGCRNLEKGEVAKQAILNETDSRTRTIVDVWEIDLDRYDSVLALSLIHI